MSLLAAVLLLWGFTLDPATAEVFDPTSNTFLWADPQSLREPWANLTLTCEARFPTKDFQLIMNGWRQSQAHVDKNVKSYQFPLGAITSENRGVYRCRCGVEPSTPVLTDLKWWPKLSNLVKVTGTEPLPPPSLSAEQVSWVTPLGMTYLLCHTAFRGVTFLLRREGDDNFLKIWKAREDVVARFGIRHPGKYSCTYRTHPEGTFSEPSATVTIMQFATPPPPTLYFLENYQMVEHPRILKPLVCKAPRDVFEFQLRRGEKVLNISGTHPSRDVSFYYLNVTEMDDQGPLTCRYTVHIHFEIWSEDSEPIELMWSDGTLPAPVLTAEPGSHNLEPGSTVHLRCTAPKAGLRFGLLGYGDTEDPLIQMLKPSGTEAVFELHNISTIDSGKYSCVYMEQAPPFSGSAPSELLELHVNGPPPRPKLEALWTGTLPLGGEANFRCHSHVTKVSMQLFREGSHTPLWTSQAMTGTSADLKLPFVGPQHSGNYSCHYTALSPLTFESGLSNPVEVIVEDI